MKNFVTKYNELLALVDGEVYKSDSSLDDKSSIRSIMTQIKDKLFGSYGSNSDKSLFNYGIELDKSGALSLNSTKFNSAVQNDLSGLKDLFVGAAEKKGLGTTLKETIDEMRYVGGTLNSYQSAMANRETKLEEEKEKAEKALNAKYEQLALQFSSYGAVINQMESSFSGLKMLIQQSTSGN
jgi:flagellar hook-associated protein 2